MSGSSSESTVANQGTAVVTGASSGIGLVYAGRLAARGHDLVLVARREPLLHELAERLRGEHGREVRTVAADLTDPGDLRRLEELLARDESVTMLVNNAGIGALGLLHERDPDALEDVIRLNITAPTRLARAVLPGMLARDRGAIVNIASILALLTWPNNAAYSGSKAYLLNFSRALQQQVEGRNVYVQAVLPAATRTGFWDVTGVDLATLPPEIVMSAEDMVDAALAGLDRREPVTIPSLQDAGRWDAFEAARQALVENARTGRPAPRYAA